MSENNINIKYYDINSLIGAEYNPRKISNVELSKLEDSIKRFGCVEPIIINIHPDRKNIIISGHQRCKVAKKLNYSQVPVTELTLKQIELYG